MTTTKAKDLIAKSTENHDYFTSAAIVGAFTGVALTSMMEGSNTTTTLISAAAGAFAAYKVYDNKSLGLIDANMGNLVTCGAMVAGITTLSGCAATLICGDHNTNSNASDYDV